MRFVTGWFVALGLCVVGANCRKGGEEAPAPAPDAAPAIDAGGSAGPADVAAGPPEPKADVAPAIDAGGSAGPAEVVPQPPEPGPDVPPVEPPADSGALPADVAATAPPAQAFLTETGAAEGLGVESIALCTAIENRMCVGEKREFAPGEMVWALLRVVNETHAETEIRVAYLQAALSPAPGQGLRLRVPAQERYTTFSKASKSADGRYDVVVTTAGGAEIARARFQVGTGENAAPAAATAPAPAASLTPPPAVPAPVAPGTALGIDSLELCRAIENRRCAEPATTYAPREMVWALLRVANPDRAETELRVSYVAAGGSPAPGEGVVLRVPAQERYTTFAKAGKANPGRYDVVVSAPDGRELARAGFEVR